ncbi:MAG: R2-like ligand-binding oxidase [Candidatus Hydrogenedentales bacterium]
MPINFETLPLREIRKGRALAWDPHAIDLSQDRADWIALPRDEQQFLIAQIVGFLIGERGVTHDLAPLQQALRQERGRMEEEMYLTQQLFEESTHVEFFQRWINEVLPEKGERVPPPPPDKGRYFSEILPEAMGALREDTSPEAQMRATVTYHQLVEGVLAEVGYEIFYSCLDTRGIMPGLRQGLRQIQQDEARHIAFGTYLAQRLISEHPSLAEVFDTEMEKLHQETVDTARDFFYRFDNRAPFGLTPDRFVDLAETLFQRRKKSVLKGHLTEA